MEGKDAKQPILRTLERLNSALLEVGFVYVTPLLNGSILDRYTNQLNHSGRLESPEVSEELSQHPIYYVFKDNTGTHSVFVGNVVGLHENGAIVCRNGAVDQILWTNQTSLN